MPQSEVILAKTLRSQPQRPLATKSKPSRELRSLRTAEEAQGQLVSLPLAEHGTLQGRIHCVLREPDAVLRLGGELVTGSGSFYCALTASGMEGIVRLPRVNRALHFQQRGKEPVQVQQLPLGAVQCHGMPAPPAGLAAMAGPGTDGVATAATGTLSVPVLDSRPAALSVIYLDFDGGLVQDPAWNSGFEVNAQPALANGRLITAAGITEVWKQVAEDFAPFDVAVTTQPERYSAAPVSQRMRVIITPTNEVNSLGGSGIALVGSFSRTGLASSVSSTVPCWVFTHSSFKPADIAMIVSHEVGHTLGLQHDGLTWVLGEGSRDYYDGHGGTDSSSWGPIMGTPYGKAITQWSRGEYYRASNTEDDLAIITSGVNGFGFAPDEAGADTLSAAELAPGSVMGSTGFISFSQAGVISSGNDDLDLWRFTTTGGAFSVTVTPALLSPNLDLSVALLTEDGVGVLYSSDPRGQAASLNISQLAEGTYHLRVRAAQVGNPLASTPSGYALYGSAGAYQMTGKYPLLPDTEPVITSQPADQAVPLGRRASFQVLGVAKRPISYQWQRDGVNLTGATLASYTLTAAQLPHEGSYRCVLTNELGSTLSAEATLQLNYKPVITQQPVSQTYPVAGTGDVTFQVEAMGTATLGYQWQRNRVAMVGEIAAQLTLAAPIRWEDAASYRCVVTNAQGSTTSAEARLTVQHVPFLTQDLASSQVLPQGGTTTLSITSAGSATLRYRWLKDTLPIPAATSSRLTLSRITAAMAGSYVCEVSNDFGLISSTACSVSVLALPSIVVHPVSTLTVPSSGYASFSVVASGGGDLHYQWQRNGVPQMDAPDGPIYSKLVQWQDAGLYRCVVSNAVGTATSRSSVLTVQSAPLAVTLPSLAKVVRGGSLRVTASVQGSPQLSYQWWKDGTPVPRQTQSTLFLSGAGDATAGDYVLEVRNAFGNSSGTVTVVVEDAPVVLTQPTSHTAGLTTSTSLSVAAASPSALPAGTASALRYQWQLNGRDVAGASSATLVIADLATGHAGSYRCRVSNDVATVYSRSAVLTLHALPAVRSHPVALTSYAYDTAVFRVVGTGTGPLRYQWQRDGVDLLPSASVLGSTTATLTLLNAQAASQGSYHCILSNTVGTATSQDAALTVLPTQEATVISIYPPVVKTGELLRVLGSHLNWTTRVHLVSGNGSQLVANVVRLSPEELLITAPAAAAGQSLPLVITTRHSSITTTQQVSFSTAAQNNSFTTARVMLPTDTSITGDNSSFTGEVDEPRHALPASYAYPSEYDAVKSAWFQWRPTISGTYQLTTAGSRFNTRLAVYSGSTFPTLTLLGSNDDADPNLRPRTSQLSLYVTAGETYFFALDGFDYSYFDLAAFRTQYVRDYGPYLLAVTRRPGG